MGPDDALASRAAEARARVVSGELRGEALRELLLAVPAHDRDGFVDAMLGLEAAPPDAPDLPRGAVPYLPARVDDVLVAVRELPLTAADHFVDLGAGLGRVVMLAHLLTGARCSGVEIQPHLVREARAAAGSLGLDALAFEEGDATTRPLEASVVFLYAPFNGAMLRRALARLEEASRAAPLAVCAVDLVLGEVPWLASSPSSSPSVVFHRARARGLTPDGCAI